MPNNFTNRSFSTTRLENLARKSNESSANDAVQIRKPARDIFAEMDAKDAAIAFRENRKITASLRGFDNTKGIFSAGNRQIHCIVARDLKKYAAIRATFVGLSRRMQETRAKTETS